eukprot:6197864-Amphidinium_carterae.1
MGGTSHCKRLVRCWLQTLYTLAPADSNAPCGYGRVVKPQTSQNPPRHFKKNHKKMASPRIE